MSSSRQKTEKVKKVTQAKKFGRVTKSDIFNKFKKIINVFLPRDLHDLILDYLSRRIHTSKSVNILRGIKYDDIEIKHRNKFKLVYPVYKYSKDVRLSSNGDVYEYDKKHNKLSSYNIIINYPKVYEPYKAGVLNIYKSILYNDNIIEIRGVHSITDTNCDLKINVYYNTKEVTPIILKISYGILYLFSNLYTSDNKIFFELFTLIPEQQHPRIYNLYEYSEVKSEFIFIKSSNKESYYKLTNKIYEIDYKNIHLHGSVTVVGNGIIHDDTKYISISLSGMIIHFYIDSNRYNISRNDEYIMIKNYRNKTYGVLYIPDIINQILY